MIQLGNNNIQSISIGGGNISKMYKGDKLVFGSEDKGNKEIPVPTFQTVIHLDQSISDPTQRVTGSIGKDGTPYNNVVSWIRSQSHRYVGTYDADKGMVLKQLNDNDSTKYADGSDASEDIKGANEGDVFMKMPDFWFYGESLDDTNDKYNILFSAIEPTDGRNWTKWEGDTLIGAYKAYGTGYNNTSGYIYSRSGRLPQSSVTQPNFKVKARNRSVGTDHFMLVTYEAHQVMALLYISYYGNTDGQANLGNDVGSFIEAGTSNILGMNDSDGSIPRQISFWGLEYWWGNGPEAIDNISTEQGSAESGIVTINDYNGNFKRRLTGWYTVQGEISKMMLGETLDMIPQSIVQNSNYDTYYCDSATGSKNASYIISRSGGPSVSGTTGPFSLYSRSDTSANASMSTRLLYKGRVTIEN